MLLALGCIIATATAVGGVEPRPADLPSLRRIGIAWEASAALTPVVQEHLLTPRERYPLGVRPYPRGYLRKLVVLGEWGQAAKSAAEEQGIDRVVLIERAHWEELDPVTKTLTNDLGQEARVRYSGVECDLQLSLRARESDWAEDASERYQDQSRLHGEIEIEDLGQVAEVSADPALELADSLLLATRRILSRSGLRRLWDTRAAWSSSSAGDPAEPAPWEWYEIAYGIQPAPFVSLSKRCRADLAEWMARWRAMKRDGESIEDCGWCGERVADDLTCPCDEAQAFGALVEGAVRLIREGHGRTHSKLTVGLLGAFPAEASSRSSELDRVLAELPDIFEARLSEPASRPARRGNVLVLVHARPLPSSLVQGFDADLASCLGQLGMLGGVELEKNLKDWRLNLKEGQAALVRLETRSSRTRAKVLEQVDLRKADRAELERLFERALYAIFEDDE